MGIFMILLLAIGFLGFFGSTIVVNAAPTIARAEYDYHIVGGYKMNPTLPAPDTSPAGFTFTLESWCGNGSGLFNLGTAGYNFGWLDVHGGREYLSAGTSISEPTGTNWNAYVVVNITNNLGYQITIEDLTIELTSGTAKGVGLPLTIRDPPTDNSSANEWLFPISGENLANVSMIVIDTLDPWDYNSIDEVDYNAGTVANTREDDYPDHFRAATGTIRPASMGRGPGSLLEPDLDGDAAATGHVAPKYGGSAITVNDGETFTEYFGVLILGLVSEYTQIDGTVTVRLYYSPPPGGTTANVDLRMSNLKSMFPAYVDDTVYFYPEWANLNFNVTFQNIGNVPIDVTVDLYYSLDNKSTWIQIGSSQNFLSLPVADGALANFNWNVKSASVPVGWHYVKANATATSATDPASPDTDDFNIRLRCVRTGNSDCDGDVDVGDQRKTQLAMFTNYPDETYLHWQNLANFGPQIFTDFDGDLDVDVGDQRKQQLQMFQRDDIWTKT